MVEQHFCLRWNNYRTNITAEFETLREGEHFVDVTLACDGQQLKAHKVVLSACSPYFKELLQGNPCTHPIIILRDVAYTHMRSLLEFMYAGEVNISQVHLGAFLHTAEALKIRGLAESSDDRKEHGGLNSNSPLSALKSSIIGLGNMGLAGLGSPSILERPLVPQLLPHHDKAGPPLGVPPHHHLPPHLVPPPLSLPGGTPLPNPPGPPSTSAAPSTPSQGALPLTVAHSQAADRPPRPPEPLERTPSPPPPLPPCKRIRLEKRTHLDSPAPPLEKNSHADPANGPPGGAAAPSAASTPTPSQPPEDLSHPVLKTEPVESLTPDTEGGAGWTTHDDGDSSSCGGGGGGCGEGGGGGRSSGGGGGGGGGGGSGGETTATPGPTPPGGTPPDHEHTSHLLQALSSESHLQGIMRSFEPLPCPICQRTYSSPGNLKQHLENIHMSCNELNFECRICGNKFKSKWYLHKHLHRAHHIRGRKEI